MENLLVFSERPTSGLLIQPQEIGGLVIVKKNNFDFKYLPHFCMLVTFQNDTHTCGHGTWHQFLKNGQILLKLGLQYSNQFTE